MAEAAKDSSAGMVRYRFDEVVVDPIAARLVIDGRPVSCSQRALQLLVCLCEAPGRTLARNELLDRLWPGGQLVADEALTQVVFRARAVLGRYAMHVVTVRGVGFRLDAEVQRLDGPLALVAHPPSAPADATTVPPQPPADAALPAPRQARGPRASKARLVVLSALLVLAASVLWLLRAGGGDAGDATPVDVGYALAPADLHAAHPDSARMLREAFAHEAAGDRARGRALFETVHDIDATTPVPALFLALWAVGGGDLPLADRWLAEASARVAPLGDPLLTALLGYVRAERDGRGQEILRRAGAVLDLRPSAWQMRLARAHLLYSDGFRDAALAELAGIDFGDLGHRKLMSALADRASLGDPDGAEAVFRERAGQLAASAQRSYLEGRLAWSRGDLDASALAYARCVAQARSEARFDLVNRSLANLGAIAVMQGRFDEAFDRLSAAREGMVASGWLTDEIDLSLMLAQLHALRGERAEMERELARAESVMARSGVRDHWPVVLLHRERLAPDPQAATSEQPAVAAMIAAQRALAAGDAARAGVELDRAARLLPPGTELHDELRWLAAALGRPLPDALPVDPPYPPLARLTTRAAIDALGGRTP